MVAQGWLPGRGPRPGSSSPKFLPEPPQAAGIPGDAGGHVYNLARAELEARGITEQEINTEGLTIDLTIDSKRQQQAVDAVDEGAQGPAGEPAQRAGLRRPEDRRDPGLLRRHERRGHRLRPGACASPARRSSRSCSRPRCRTAARTVGLGSIYDGSSPQTFLGVAGRQLRGLQLHPVRRADGDDQVGQHRLLQDGHRHRPAAGGRRRAPGRHPRRRAAQPDGRHRAGRQGGPADRHGVGLRDVRRRRDPARPLRGRQGHRGRRPRALRPRHGDRSSRRCRSRWPATSPSR